MMNLSYKYNSKNQTTQDEIMSVCRLRRGYNLARVGVRPRVGDVIIDRAGKEEILLEHNAELLAELRRNDDPVRRVQRVAVFSEISHYRITSLLMLSILRIFVTILWIFKAFCSICKNIIIEGEKKINR